jgi:hypothetical protein
MLPSQVLDKAADLITPDGAWTQGHGAHKADGNITGARSPDATCWCLHGAVLAASGQPFADRAEAFVERALGMEHITDAYDWNDDPARTQPEVVAALRKAADLARSEGQ